MSRCSHSVKCHNHYPILLIVPTSNADDCMSDASRFAWGIGKLDISSPSPLNALAARKPLATSADADEDDDDFGSWSSIASDPADVPDAEAKGSNDDDKDSDSSEGDWDLELEEQEEQDNESYEKRGPNDTGKSQISSLLRSYVRPTFVPPVLHSPRLCLARRRSIPRSRLVSIGVSTGCKRDDSIEGAIATNSARCRRCRRWCRRQDRRLPEALAAVFAYDRGGKELLPGVSARGLAVAACAEVRQRLPPTA